ncbi:hypothetical protein PIB30_011288 [Stylosanthes scabra]|uniref:Uncharacterized protein n=1 Tax=Stylosanthes scabra TaxID=79078 RepID=A0ABU6V814_9FABA|nr:hypothetical protein [Stylosanthes scabra]
MVNKSADLGRRRRGFCPCPCCRAHHYAAAVLNHRGWILESPTSTSPITVISSSSLCGISPKVLKPEFMHGDLVLNCGFHDDSSNFNAATVRRLLFGSNRDDILGKHNALVRCVESPTPQAESTTNSLSN